MKRKITVLLIGTCFTAALLAGCGQRMNGAQGQSGTSAQDTTGTQASGNGASNGTTQSSGTAITEEDAKTIALDQAGIAESDTIGLAVKQDFDDGMTVYEVDIYTPDTDYEYEVNVADGTIVKEDRSTTDKITTDPGTAITPDKAKEIVLAKVSGAEDKNLRMKAERDDGRTCYEGEVIYNGKSYEFELDAQTGDILEWSEEALGY